MGQSLPPSMLGTSLYLRKVADKYFSLWCMTCRELSSIVLLWNVFLINFIFSVTLKVHLSGKILWKKKFVKHSFSTMHSGTRVCMFLMISKSFYANFISAGGLNLWIFFPPHNISLVWYTHSKSNANRIFIFILFTFNLP